MRKTAKKSNKKRSAKKKKGAKKRSKIAYVLLIVLIPSVVYMLCFSSMVYEVDVIENHMAKAQLVGHALTLNSIIITYMWDKDEEHTLGLEVLTTEEKNHLLDVKKVVHRTFDVLFFSLIWMFALLWDNNKITKSKNFGKILKYAGLIIVAVPLIFVLFPFDLFFSMFHSVFFVSGTWMFPPKSALLQIYPIVFWKSAGFWFFLRGFVTGWLLIGWGFLVDKH